MITTVKSEHYGYMDCQSSCKNLTDHLWSDWNHVSSAHIGTQPY